MRSNYQVHRTWTHQSILVHHRLRFDCEVGSWLGPISMKECMQVYVFEHKSVRLRGEQADAAAHRTSFLLRGT